MRQLFFAVCALLALAGGARADSGLITLRQYNTITSTSNIVVSTLNVVSTPMKFYALQVAASSGTPTSWSVALEGCLELCSINSSWTNILTHSDADGNGKTKVTTTPFVSSFLRVRSSTTTFGTSVTLNTALIGIQ